MHGALIALGLVLLYGWMATLPLFGDSLYVATSRLNVNTFGDYLGVLNPRVDAALEATRVLPLYRPVFFDVIVPLVQSGLPQNPAAIYALTLAVGLSTAMTFYVLSFRVSNCQDSAFMVAAFVIFHPALFEIFLAGYAGLSALVTYLLIVLSLIFAWRLVHRPRWRTLAAVVTLGFLATFSWERASLLPLGLLLVVVGGRLVHHREAGGGGALWDFCTIWFGVLVVACLATPALYFAARTVRFGTAVASHYDAGTFTIKALLKQVGALGLGVVGILPPYVPEWFGVDFVHISWPARLLVLGYAFLVIGSLSYCLWKRPRLGVLGLAVAAALILPNVAARHVLTIRYSDMLVLGLAVTLSSVPLLTWTSPGRRLWLSLATFGLLFAVAVVHERVTLSSPHHYLARATRSATAIRVAVTAASVAIRTRDIQLMSGFFNQDEMWVFSATPSRLGSFLSVNFPIDRTRIHRFSLALLIGKPTVLADYYYEPDGASIRIAGLLTQPRVLSAPVPAHWENGVAFSCRGGDVLVISGHRTTERSNDRQYIRIVYNRQRSFAFTVLELFGNYQELRRREADDESQVYSLVPVGTDSCQVMPDGLAAGNTVTRVERLMSDG